MNRSYLEEALAELTRRSTASLVARSRIASAGLNAALLRRLAAAPGKPGSFLAAPVFEVGRAWKQAPETLADLSGGLLHPDLVAALDGASTERMPRDRHPYAHQIEAWRAARDGLSCLVTSGTGSGKTECFMVPLLDDLLRDPAKGRLSGVRAIVIYPLNALIESQRERLAAWTQQLGSRVTFALYNGLTPESRGGVRRPLARAELGDRKSIREAPPAILITNVTMLEYLLLRARDRTILERSKGLLRWIVLDEAHSYIGAQAAEMALLLRRVRAAFGVSPDQVRLMATSATIGEGERTAEKLQRFVSDLGGVEEAHVQVIEGRTAEPTLPPPGPDVPLDPAALSDLADDALWDTLAPHPRLQKLKREMSERGITASDATRILFGDGLRDADVQAVLDAAARAVEPTSGQRFLPWRVHLFHRSQGGLWACVDPGCAYRDPELVEDACWGFGAMWLEQRDRCECGAPVFEIESCSECGAPYLVAGREAGVMARLVPLQGGEIDDYAVDDEPDPDADASYAAREKVWLAPARGDGLDRHLVPKDGRIFDNGPPEDEPSIRIRLVDDAAPRDCCTNASERRLQPARYGPPFFMGNILPLLLERLAPPSDQPGLPMGGRRALSFSDSRQGVARLAAKLQQDAERTLTRAFLYHAVQENTGPTEEERAKKEAKLASMREHDPEIFADDIERLERELAGSTEPVGWKTLIRRLSQHQELREFAGDVWAERAWGGREMADDPDKLAEMFLYRELFRRPRIQNNAETMGLVRLTFPTLEEAARLKVPRPLAEAGKEAEAWAGLAASAIDFVFRDSLAIDVGDARMVRWVSPRWGSLQGIANGHAPADRPANCRPWPGPVPAPGRPSRLLKLIYRLIDGNPESRLDQDRAEEVLTALWQLVTKHAARDVGQGAWRLDFSKAAAARFGSGWLCPVTRRALGYSPGGLSPFGPDDPRPLAPLAFPQLPVANPGGLDREGRQRLQKWCAEDSTVADLRKSGLWTDLHDRVATFAPFLRAQEHSAQIERPVLQIYEEAFKAGKINLLNCSTTMEMGVDIPNVALVVNANVPPSPSNYRQRVGRAGRRGEPWAFAATFCRNLPLDRAVFDDPVKLLSGPVLAPAVRLDLVPVVVRHVHAALLAAFLHDQSEGFDLRASTGAFFGAGDEATQPVIPDSPADRFLSALRAFDFTERQSSQLERLTHGSALATRHALSLCAGTAEAFETLLRRWRAEYAQLLEGAAAASESDVRQAFVNRAKRMKGEFLLSELARRGFTPSYGFPVDVVTFDHLDGRRGRGDASDVIAFGYRRGGASRTLDVAIREYAPGAEIVIDGLVHQSEGIQPAWAAMADASGLEDLLFYWWCPSCRGFGLVRTVPETCPRCDAPAPRWQWALRPAGFLGRRAPHTGYENLGTVPFQMPSLSAAGAAWQALPDPEAGRIRIDPVGLLVHRASGPNGKGYALCLTCGRATAEEEEPGGPVPGSMKEHNPLAPLRHDMLVKGRCPGGLTRPERIKRNVRLVQETRTDIFELQLPHGRTRATGLALAAGLREALAERLGAEAREIGVAVGASQGPAGEARVSAYLHDRAAGGAGLVARLAEPDWFAAAMGRAAAWLDCREKCEHGCPACILRPDLNFGEERPDRRAAAALASDLVRRCELPESLRFFGPLSRLLGLPAADWLEHRRLAGSMTGLILYLHGAPADWELAAWPVADLLPRVAEAGCPVRLVLGSETLTDQGLDMARKLDLHRLAARGSLAYTSDLPRAGDAPLIAVIEIGEGRIGLATSDHEAAVPGPEWGLGARSPIVRGPAATPDPAEEFPAARLVELTTGNSRLIWLGKELDGHVANFGKAFWKTLAAADPLGITALRTHGVREAAYADRYLLAPLHLRLLHEVVRTLPGRAADTHLTIDTAKADRPGQNGWAIFNPWAEDGQRGAVMNALFPRATVRIATKADLPHGRSLMLGLGDGRRIRLLLDQGFGAWRTKETTRHDFRADPASQARSLRTAEFEVRMADERGSPIVLEEVGPRPGVKR